MSAVDLSDVTPGTARPEFVPAKARRNPDQMRGRIRIATGLFGLAYLMLVGRLVMFGLMPPTAANEIDPAASAATGRPDLVDRNGEVLATDVKMASLFAEPRNILDADEATELLTSALPDLDAAATRKKLSGENGFVWLKREITPTQQTAIHTLGIPGIGFLREDKRFYPGGASAAHLMGLVNIDNQGTAGIEKYVDDHGLRDLHSAGFGHDGNLEPVRLSIDARVQHILRDELSAAMERYRAIAASGVIINVHTGEVLAMASLPDYDPNDPVDAQKPDRLNRISAGVYELGSVFKSFTFAMGLDTGKWKLSDSVDASHDLRIGRFTIHDFHAKHRVLTLPEVFIFSSNIGAARMALRVGADGQREYFRRFGLLRKPTIELPETAPPIVPSRWSDLTTATAAFGHGIAVTPLQVAVADAALMNGGKLIPPTLFPRSREEAEKLAVQVVKPETSAQLRYLFQLNVEKGSGTRAAVPGYLVGGKTGTADKVENGRYSARKNLNSFLAAFPMDDPQFAVLVVLDEPQPEKQGAGSVAGMNAAPTVGAIIRRAAALLGVKPRTTGENGAILVSN
jgi:cell division protein FtsI (penicillin-binding protein 3)